MAFYVDLINGLKGGGHVVMLLAEYIIFLLPVENYNYLKRIILYQKKRVYFV